MDRKIKIITKITDENLKEVERTKTLSNISEDAEDKSLKAIADAYASLVDGDYVKALKQEVTQL